jgi:hypothetical protein
MRRVLLSLTIAVLPSLSPAQETETFSGADLPSREARLKAAVARDRGEITALEPMPESVQGVIVGYSSGAVLHCHGEDRCTEYAGTPNAAVRHLAVAAGSASTVVWAAYPQGALYQCTGGRCEKFLWDTSQDR